MDANGFLRVLIVFMRPYESLWVLIVPFAFSWILMGFMGPYSSLWILMCLNGSLPVLISHYGL